MDLYNHARTLRHTAKAALVNLVIRTSNALPIKRSNTLSFANPARTMPPIPPPAAPRVVVYYQTHHHPNSESISILPLITEEDIHVTHVIVAAIHINDRPSPSNPKALTLNDHSPYDERYDMLWAELSILQEAGVGMLGMLGGAAKGSFERLDGDQESFEAHYGQLHDLIREKQMDGLDLDIEEPMQLAGVVRLIDRLKLDFGPDFIITLAPVAAALMTDVTIENYATFSYEALEVMRGHCISWYNTQFYCGWGDISTTSHFDLIMRRGWPAGKVVVGLMSNPSNGPGWVPLEVLWGVMMVLRARYKGLGGVMAWEYFNSLPGDKDAPWEWARWMSRNVRGGVEREVRVQQGLATEATVSGDRAVEVEDDEAPVPGPFEYLSDGEETV